MAIVLMDMDGPLADWEGGIIAGLEARGLPTIPKEERDGRSCQDQYDERFPGRGMGADIRHLVNSEGFYLGLEPVPGAAEGLRELAFEGHQTFICTSPMLGSLHCASEKFLWVRERLGEGWDERLIVTKDKTMVRGDVLVDDKAYVRSFGEVAPTWEQVLYRECHNRGSDWPGPRMDWDTLFVLLHVLSRPLDTSRQGWLTPAWDDALDFLW